MSDQTEFLLLRAKHEHESADAAILENVKRCHLRSAEAWTKLAERSARGDRLRSEEALRKAERDAERALDIDNPAERDPD